MIDVALVLRLVASQFPQWGDLPIWPVARSGWDNRTFHLGKHMLVRMPTAAEYASQVEKESKWLPKLAPLLPLPIPESLAVGEPNSDYSWKWSIYRWIEGESAALAPIADRCQFAASLAQFLAALQRIDPSGGPLPGPHSFYRGGSLATYDAETRQAIKALKDQINVDAATKIWEKALLTNWQHAPVWAHGDVRKLLLFFWSFYSSFLSL
jgi:aminoglycoside phosphotransferase (APT) family kinase protein